MSVCRRARELAKEEINGNYKYEFKRLFDYANALRRADTDGIIDLLGMLEGALLVVVERDANNMMYPIA
ncbi:hypothetical protein V6N13_082514 [Hibiscus sabdariffa]